MVEPSELLLQKLPEIERVAEAICRRQGVDADAIEEFAAELKLKLVEDDYAVIRKFSGRSTFLVYIAAVIRRLLLDCRNREWGKWRTSAEAERLGPIAVDLERLLYRDHRSLDEALIQLQPRYPDVTIEELERLAQRLKPRLPRRKVELQAAAELPAAEDRHDVVGSETAARLSEAVSLFIDELPEDDQLLFHLRFASNMTVAQIARALGIDQQLLYRRLRKRCEELRSHLQAIDIDATDVEALIGNDSILLNFHLKNRTVRPSEQKESAAAARREKMSS